jgi:cytochrome c553
MRKAVVQAAWLGCAGWVLMFTGLAARAAPPELHLQLCAACHGPGGNSVIPDNPKLAGLDADYVMRQLSDFKSGKRKNPVMGQIVATLDSDSLRLVAEYYSEQKREAASVTDAALAAKGQQIFADGVVTTAVPDCGSCHGADGSGDAKYPRLAGQHASYLEKQMLAFKSGERNNDAKGVMAAVAQRMNEAEIRAVAQYLAGLKEE